MTVRDAVQISQANPLPPARAAIPWRRWFSFAVLSLGLAPEAFWSLTLAEWRFLAPDDAGALGRARLDELIALYPDNHS